MVEFKYLSRLLLVVLLGVTAIDSLYHGRLYVDWNLIISILGMLIFSEWKRAVG